MVGGSIHPSSLDSLIYWLRTFLPSSGYLYKVYEKQIVENEILLRSCLFEFFLITSRLLVFRTFQKRKAQKPYYSELLAFGFLDFFFVFERSKCSCSKASCKLKQIGSNTDNIYFY